MPTIIDGTNGIDKIAAGAIEYADLPTGSVLQVVQATLSGYFRTTSTSYVDSGLTATITPKFSNSKILAFANCNGVGKETTNNTVKYQMVRGSTSIYFMGDLNAYNNTATDLCIGSLDGNYLDSPATTSATTYKIQIASFNGGGVYLNWYNNSNTVTSSITLMEIAA